MSEKPVRIEEQAMPGYVRRVPVYRKVCALDGCSVEFEGPARQKYCTRGHAMKAAELRNIEGRRRRQREYQRRKTQRAKGSQEGPTSGG